LYRALRLLASTAQDGPVTPLAREGGLSSTLWAGPEVTRWQRGRPRPEEGRTLRRGPVRLQLGFVDDELGYAIDLGLPPPSPPATFSEPTMFQLDPEIKRECVWWGDVLQPRKLLADRDRAHVNVRDSAGHWTELTSSLPPWR